MPSAYSVGDVVIFTLYPPLCRHDEEPHSVTVILDPAPEGLPSSPTVRAVKAVFDVRNYAQFPFSDDRGIQSCSVMAKIQEVSVLHPTPPAPCVSMHITLSQQEDLQVPSVPLPPVLCTSPLPPAPKSLMGFSEGGDMPLPIQSQCVDIEVENERSKVREGHSRVVDVIRMEILDIVNA